ncbi:uncharacterized protein EDB93DRAFT_825075 [Suillus bovinus]|uniref:uncharacterized protein n=1 Tax=Suillus bovinus TaxID=48563 RepID=UPI001B878616|nr:uncharacterized protein EDB93DRAFT_825075 [Suillus bovinus]KAG2135358.1 hypothetical protein EDB93DRAFT_825075 [Suillus bovinus]
MMGALTPLVIVAYSILLLTRTEIESVAINLKGINSRNDLDVAGECLSMENHIYADITGEKANLKYTHTETLDHSTAFSGG